MTDLKNISQPLAITAAGMVTGVGLDAASSCAAIRAAIDNFQETRFMDAGGEWIMGCEVPLEQPWRGTRKLAKMLARALTECATEAQVSLEQIPLIICLAEQERPGRFDDLSNRVFNETQQELGIHFHPDSRLIEQGRVGGLSAMKHARAMIYDKNVAQVIIAGVDSLLTAPALRVYEEQDRVLTSQNSDGFIPGEAAAAVLVMAPKAIQKRQLLCLGLGFSDEQVTIDSEQVFRADGLTKALKQTFEDANMSMNEMDFRIVDVAGGQYWFKETALVLARLLRVHKERFPLWHPTDCIGEVGAAISIVTIVYLKIAFEKGFNPGVNALQHISNNDQRRAGAIFQYQKLS